MTQFIFFSGKGGVGKTSMACTHAVRYADEGKRTLIVTTDPASNLADVFEQEIGHQVTPIAGVPNLWAMEIDPDQATQEYIDRAMAPIRAAFPPQMVQVMEEQMSGPCTAEVAAFDRFTDFLDVPADHGEAFDVVIFDTAPTGHTMRLLELPAEWSQSIDAASAGSGQTCIGPAAAIQDAKHKYERALAAMRESAADDLCLCAASRGDCHQRNPTRNRRAQETGHRKFPPDRQRYHPARSRSKPALCRPRRDADPLPGPNRNRLALHPAAHVPAGRRNQGRGAAARGGWIFFDGESVDIKPTLSAETSTKQRLSSDVDVRARVQPNGHRRTVFFAGKGGVGKTVASCITAVWLARQGYKTLLLTTDPAAHLGDVLGVPVGADPAAIPGLDEPVGGQDRSESRRRNLQDAHPGRCPPARPARSGHPGHGRGTRFALHRGDGRLR